MNDIEISTPSRYARNIEEADVVVGDGHDGIVRGRIWDRSSGLPREGGALGFDLFTQAQGVQVPGRDCNYTCSITHHHKHGVSSEVGSIYAHMTLVS